jgi:hypothetical protein
VTFNKAHKLAREVTLPGRADLTLTISEPLNGAKTHVLPVKVSARALFNRCSVTPAQGINFGPLQYATTSRPRCACGRQTSRWMAAPHVAGYLAWASIAAAAWRWQWTRPARDARLFAGHSTGWQTRRWRRPLIAAASAGARLQDL